ncbi:MAG: hypothetical protein K1Y36_25555 [Blastocatellia bacterium]|nr:hypothetical protein [Blastocatellia bacterium]
MGNVNALLQEAMQIDGAIGVALVDWETGMCLGTAGGGPTLNLDIAAAGNTEVVRSKQKVMAATGITDSIEDILITLTTHYHLIRLNAKNRGLFFYLALHRSKANLAMARLQLATIEAKLQL